MTEMVQQLVGRIGRRNRVEFGSVRFFKRAITFIVAAYIVITLFLCIYLGHQNQKNLNAIEELELRYETMAQSLLTTEAPPEKPTATLEYQSLYPDLYCQEKTSAFAAAEDTVYLTFDDGPSQRTPEVLEILKQYGIKATFFVVGTESQQSKEWMRQIVEEGHTLGIHSYTHKYEQVYESVESYLEDFNRMYQLIYETTGVSPEIFRFPGGSVNSYNSGIYKEITAEMLRRGFTYYDWNVSSQDAAFKKATVEGIQSNVVNSAKGKSQCIVLLHDNAGKTNTVAALPGIIDSFIEKGYSFDKLTSQVPPITFGYSD